MARFRYDPKSTLRTLFWRDRNLLFCGRECSGRFEPGEPLSARSSLRARGPAAPLPVLAAFLPAE